MFFLEQPIFLFLIAICLVLSIVTPSQRPLNIVLPVFFALLLAVEITCYYLKAADKNNLIVYNFWFPVEYIVYTYWIVSYINSRLFKRIYMFLLPLYVIVVIVIYFFYDHLLKFNSYSFQLGFLLLLPALLFKLYEYINGNIIFNPVKTPQFWLITGLLFSYMFSLSQFSMQNYLNHANRDLLDALSHMNVVLTDVLYLCIIIYFALKWKNKSSHI